MIVKILQHSAATDADLSGVQTSDGDHFAGDVVELPDNEAAMLIAIDRAEKVSSDTAVARKQKQKAS